LRFLFFLHGYSIVKSSGVVGLQMGALHVCVNLFMFGSSATHDVVRSLALLSPTANTAAPSIAATTVGLAGRSPPLPCLTHSSSHIPLRITAPLSRAVLWSLAQTLYAAGEKVLKEDGHILTAFGKIGQYVFPSRESVERALLYVFY
jgi:hypothetical protein